MTQEQISMLYETDAILGIIEEYDAFRNWLSEDEVQEKITIEESALLLEMATDERNVALRKCFTHMDRRRRL